MSDVTECEDCYADLHCGKCPCCMGDDIEAERALLRLILKGSGYVEAKPRDKFGDAFLVVDISADITLEQAALIERIWGEGE